MYILIYLNHVFYHAFINIHALYVYAVNCFNFIKYMSSDRFPHQYMFKLQLSLHVSKHKCWI